MMEKVSDFYRPKSNWLGRSLANYKDMHASAAKAKGRLPEFLAARTLTEARKIAFGNGRVR